MITGPLNSWGSIEICTFSGHGTLVWLLCKFKSPLGWGKKILKSPLRNYFLLFPHRFGISFFKRNSIEMGVAWIGNSYWLSLLLAGSLLGIFSCLSCIYDGTNTSWTGAYGLGSFMLLVTSFNDYNKLDWYVHICLRYRVWANVTPGKGIFFRKTKKRS